MIELVDECIDNYERITVSLNGNRQSIFIDLIIRLLIVKGYIISMLNKPVKAANEFIKAEELIRKIGQGEMRIVTQKDFP